MGNLTMARWVRAAVLSLLVVASTLAAHVCAGGTLPDVALLLPVCAIVTLLCAALLRRPLSWWWSAAMLLAGQAVLHGALQLAPRAGPAAGGGHLSGAGAHAVPGADQAALRALTAWSGDARMVVAHVGVAVLVGAWLAAVERAVWSLVALAAGTLTAAWLRAGRARSLLLSPSLVLPRRLSVPCALVTAPVGVGEVGAGATRRGPPARGCARSL